MIDKQKLDWLKARKQRIQASEVAAIIGEDPRRGPIDVYLDKTTDEIDENDKIWLAYGRDNETAIANAFQYITTGITVLDLGATTIQVHPDIPWLGSTWDRAWIYDDDKKRVHHPLECKNVSGFDNIDGKLKYIRPDEWKVDPPENNLIQNQIQQSCGQSPLGTVCAMFPGTQVRYVHQERDDEFLELIYPVLDEFWGRVQRREPPSLESQPVKRLEAMKRLWSRESGETVPMTTDDLALVDQWEMAKATGREADKQAKEIQAQLWERLGEATFGALPDGTMLALKTQTRKEHTVKASEFRVMRRFRPKGK